MSRSLSAQAESPARCRCRTTFALAVLAAASSIHSSPIYWRSYFAGHPSTDGRKSYWQHQLGSVACSDSLGSSTTCISAGGGHTWALLQVIDDAGVFRGWVGVEASLHIRATGNAIVASGYWVQP